MRAGAPSRRRTVEHESRWPRRARHGVAAAPWPEIAVGALRYAERRPAAGRRRRLAAAGGRRRAAAFGLISERIPATVPPSVARTERPVVPPMRSAASTAPCAAL